MITPTTPLSGLTSPGSSSAARSPPIASSSPSSHHLHRMACGAVDTETSNYVNVPTNSAATNATNADAIVAADVPELTDGKKISIVVFLGQPESFARYVDEQMADADADLYSGASVKSSSLGDDASSSLGNGHGGGGGDLNADGSGSGNGGNSAHQRCEFTIAYTYISEKTTWQNLDYIVRKTFKDYVARIDPGTNLGLNTDSITSYHLGEAKRGPEVGFPELLPCGYIVGHVRALYICLQGVGSLAFESLIPKSIVHRYISLLTEHRRLILCGPSGTGKSYLARKLAEFLVARTQRENPWEAIATFK